MAIKILLIALGTGLLGAVLVVIWLLGGIAILRGGHLKLVPLVSSEVVKLDSITFQQPWLIKGARPGEGHIVTGIDRYKIRISSTNPGEVLFRVVEGSLGDPLSDNAVAISNGRLVPREVTQDEWNGATEPPMVHAPIFKTGAQGPQTNQVKYAGKTFSSTGPAVRVALPSPDAKWLAVLSETVEDQNHAPRISLMPFLEGDGGPREGDYFIDIFDIATGIRIASGRMHYTPRGGSMFRSEAVWVGNNYFVVPTKITFSSCVMASIKMPQGNAK
jgi:hypothetical protein